MRRKVWVCTNLHAGILVWPIRYKWYGIVGNFGRCKLTYKCPKAFRRNCRILIFICTCQMPRPLASHVYIFTTSKAGWLPYSEAYLRITISCLSINLLYCPVGFHLSHAIPKFDVVEISNCKSFCSFYFHMSRLIRNIRNFAPFKISHYTVHQKLFVSSATKWIQKLLCQCSIIPCVWYTERCIEQDGLHRGNTTDH